MVIIICGKSGAGLSLTGINFELAIKDLDHFGFFLLFLHLLLSFISVGSLFKVGAFYQWKKLHFFYVFEEKIKLHRRFPDIRITESYIYMAFDKLRTNYISVY